MCVIRHGGKTTTKPGSETDRTPWRSYGTSPSDSSASTANTRSKKRPKRSAETGTEPSTYYSPKVTIMTDGNHDAALVAEVPPESDSASIPPAAGLDIHRDQMARQNGQRQLTR